MVSEKCKYRNSTTFLIFLIQQLVVSLKNQLKILKSIKTAEKNGCQIFIATHSYILIKNMKTVFDVSIGDWITSESKDVNL